MFGMEKRKRVAITTFNKGGVTSVASHIEDEFTKKEVLKKVSEWWDNHGTGLDDYDGIQVVFRLEKEANND